LGSIPHGLKSIKIKNLSVKTKINAEKEISYIDIFLKVFINLPQWPITSEGAAHLVSCSLGVHRVLGLILT